MLAPTYPIVTERLALRPFALDDLEALYAIQSREDVARYAYWAPRSRDEVREALPARTRMSAVNVEGESLVLAVTLRDGGALVVLERLGMRREAHFRENEWVKGEWTDELVYAMLASEWERR